MALEPITRQEKIIAGENLTPITRLEKFLKQYGGGSGSGGDTVLDENGKLLNSVLPEGYPSKSVGTVTLMEEQEVTFADKGGGAYRATAPVEIDVSDGQAYTVMWDGVEYNCVGHVKDGVSYIGNPAGLGAESTGEPFLYATANKNTLWFSYDTSTSHAIKVTTIGTVYRTIDVNMLPKAGENYGVVKKDEIVTAYKFPGEAPHDQMVAAITAFETGNASIVWDGYKVLHAYYSPSDDTITVVFSHAPMQVITCENIGGFYKVLSGADTYGELQGSQVRIINSNNSNAYAVLSVEGESYNTTLDVSAERISMHKVYGMSATEIILKSSTTNSKKNFKITVDDSGTISATEVT